LIALLERVDLDVLLAGVLALAAFEEEPPPIDEENDEESDENI
jgi:hypothetical protein